MSILRIMLAAIVLSSFGLSTLIAADETAPASEQQLLSLADQKFDIAKLAKVPTRTYTVRVTMHTGMKQQPTLVTEAGKLILSQRMEEGQLILHEKNDYAIRLAPLGLDLYEYTQTVHNDGLLRVKKFLYAVKMDLTEPTLTVDGEKYPLSRVDSLEGIPEQFHGKIIDYAAYQGEVRQGQIHYKALMSKGKPVEENANHPEVPPYPYNENTLTPMAFLRIVQQLPTDPNLAYKVEKYADPRFLDMWKMIPIGSLTLRYEGPERIRIGDQEHDCHRFLMTPDKLVNERIINCAWRAWVDKQGVLQKFELWNINNAIYTGTLGDPGPIPGGDGYMNMMKNFK